MKIIFAFMVNEILVGLPFLVGGNGHLYFVYLIFIYDCKSSFSVMMEFITLHGRFPDPSRQEEDVVEILTIKNALLDKLSVPPEKVKNDFAR